MSPRSERAAAGSQEITELREEVANLKNHVRLLVNAIDEVRELIDWVTSNGLPPRDSLPTSPVLKRMAADPSAKDWNDRLVIVRGNGDSQKGPAGNSHKVSSPPDTEARDSLQFEPGDAVDFILDGQDEFGEIVAINHAIGKVTVILIPSQREVVVSPDLLTKVEMGDDESAMTNDTLPTVSLARPPSGKLFAEPGDQPTLF